MVTFRDARRSSLGWYLETGEWRERAGAYAIQGHGAALVERIEGDYWNVVGLPVPLLLGLAPEPAGSVTADWHSPERPPWRFARVR